MRRGRNPAKRQGGDGDPPGNEDHNCERECALGEAPDHSHGSRGLYDSATPNSFPFPSRFIPVNDGSPSCFTGFSPNLHRSFAWQE